MHKLEASVDISRVVYVVKKTFSLFFFGKKQEIHKRWVKLELSLKKMTFFLNAVSKTFDIKCVAAAALGILLISIKT